MKLFGWILNLFKRKPKVSDLPDFKYTPNLPPIEPIKEEKKTPLQRKRAAIERWRNKTYKGKAHRMPLAKFLNPEKYFILILFFILSCSKKTDKDEKVCYYCTFALFGAYQEPPRSVCIFPWEDIKRQKFMDSRGNDLSATCQKK